MAYGSLDGLKNNIKDYAALLTAGTLTAAGVTEARRRADQKIDTMLSSIVPTASLPLTNGGPVAGISDDLTSCYLLRGIYTQKDPKQSDWVQDFCDRAQEELEELMKHPEIIEDAAGSPLNQVLPDSTTLNQDREFTVTTTSGDGASILISGTMEDW